MNKLLLCFISILLILCSSYSDAHFFGGFMAILIARIALLLRYPGALREMKQKGELWRFARHRRGCWFNSRVEQDHCWIKRLTRPMFSFYCFWTAKRMLAGVEAMAILAKGPV